MKHLKPDEVEYSTRPLTLYEKGLELYLEKMDARDPSYYQVWAAFLWSRQDEVLPQEWFTDILISDFKQHQEKCTAAQNKNKRLDEVVEQLETQWRFGFKDRDNDPERQARFEEWKRRSL